MSAQPQASKLVSKLYNAAYRVGFSPWDIGPPKPELVELIEGPEALSPGRAVDLGCGAGTKSVYLAEHGWQVTGVDNSAEALEQARAKVADAGVPVELIQCDLLNMPDGAVPGDFDLVLDIGCCHSLSDEAKPIYAKSAASLARPGATLFMFAFTKGPLSVRQSEIDEHFTPYWDLMAATPGSERRTPDAGPMWYRLTRRG